MFLMDVGTNTKCVLSHSGP